MSGHILGGVDGGFLIAFGVLGLLVLGVVRVTERLARIVCFGLLVLGLLVVVLS